MPTIGARVQAARTAAGLTQQQLATAAETSSGVISEIERGVYQSPGIDLMRRIAEALGVSIDGLAGHDAKAAAKRKTAAA